MSRAQKLTGTAYVQIAPGDLKAIIRLCHGPEPRAGGFTQTRRVARGVQQHASGCRRPTPYPAAQLVQLTQTKALSVFDHHQRRIGHINTHFNHRGADQNGQMAFFERSHHGLLFVRMHARMQQPHLYRLAIGELRALQSVAQFGVRLQDIGQVQRFALFNQRAYPIDLATIGRLDADAFDYLVTPRLIDHLGDDGCAARW